jgi:hypothetical protein
MQVIVRSLASRSGWLRSWRRLLALNQRLLDEWAHSVNVDVRGGEVQI